MPVTYNVEMPHNGGILLWASMVSERGVGPGVFPGVVSEYFCSLPTETDLGDKDADLTPPPTPETTMEAAGVAAPREAPRPYFLEDDVVPARRPTREKPPSYLKEYECH